ncbi:Ran-specific GTPase-activating protein 30 [Sporothrix eucalyptigena]
MSNDLENTSVLLLKRDMTAAVPTDPVGLVEAEEKDENRESASNGTSYEQDEIDRQLREECCSFEGPNNEKGTEKNSRQGGWRFPGHLDPEWLALEVFVEDSGNPGDGDSDSEELSNSDSDSTVEDEETLTKPAHDQRTSIDSRLAEKMRNMSVLDTAATPNQQQDSNNKNNSPGQDQVQPHVAQSPFGSVISSLSLLEMLVRLTSLQQFQQISHLSIPDHILTFFLEETSATGLRGEDRWNAKRAAEVKMGFDPYTDTPDRAKIGRKAMLQEDRRAGLHESREQDSGLQ